MKQVPKVCGGAGASWQGSGVAWAWRRGVGVTAVGNRRSVRIGSHGGSRRGVLGLDGPVASAEGASREPRLEGAVEGALRSVDGQAGAVFREELHGALRE